MRLMRWAGEERGWQWQLCNIEMNIAHQSQFIAGSAGAKATNQPVEAAKYEIMGGVTGRP